MHWLNSQRRLESAIEERQLQLVEFFQCNCAAVQDSAGRALVLKLIDNSKAEFEREVGFARLAQEQGFGPAVLGAEYVRADSVGLLLLERWDLTLEQVLSLAPLRADALLLRRVQRHLRRILRRLRRLGLVHADLRPRNVVCRVRGQRLLDVALIDFGLSFYAHEVGSPHWPALDVLHEYFSQLAGWPGHSAAALAAQPHLLDQFVLDQVK